MPRLDSISLYCLTWSLNCSYLINNLIYLQLRQVILGDLFLSLFIQQLILLNNVLKSILISWANSGSINKCVLGAILEHVILIIVVHWLIKTGLHLVWLFLENLILNLLSIRFFVLREGQVFKLYWLIFVRITFINLIFNNHMILRLLLHIFGHLRLISLFIFIIYLLYFLKLDLTLSKLSIKLVSLPFMLILLIVVISGCIFLIINLILHVIYLICCCFLYCFLYLRIRLLS